MCTYICAFTYVYNVYIRSRRLWRRRKELFTGRGATIELKPRALIVVEIQLVTPPAAIGGERVKTSGGEAVFSTSFWNNNNNNLISI